MTIFNNANVNQQKELSFLRWLIEHFPSAVVKKETYILPDSLAKKTLNTRRIAAKIKENQVLSLTKKEKCIRELMKLPAEIKVVRSINSISVDFTIVDNTKIQFIEFHEKQHKIDSNNRLKNVYDLNDDDIKVPRYLQRLLRDIWRVKYLTNYKIVWYDWYEKSKKDIFRINQNEFALDGHFKLSDLV